MTDFPEKIGRLADYALFFWIFPWLAIGQFLGMDHPWVLAAFFLPGVIGGGLVCAFFLIPVLGLLCAAFSSDPR